MVGPGPTVDELNLRMLQKLDHLQVLHIRTSSSGPMKQIPKDQILTAVTCMVAYISGQGTYSKDHKLVWWNCVPEDLEGTDCDHLDLQGQYHHWDAATWWPVVAWRFKPQTAAWVGSDPHVSCVVQGTEEPLVAWPISVASWIEDITK